MNRRWAFTELVRPLPLGAVALLAINDAWLKPAFHNALTGKLSDLAGCFVFPLYLAAVLGLLAPCLSPRVRLLVGSAVTVGLFSALELSPTAISAFCGASQHAAAVLGIHRPCRLTADPTDLLALIMVPLAHVHHGYGDGYRRWQSRRLRHMPASDPTFGV
jgi:hypothetical protein